MNLEVDFSVKLTLSDETPPKRRKTSCSDTERSSPSPAKPSTSGESSSKQQTSKPASSPAVTKSAELSVKTSGGQTEKEQGQGDIKDKEVKIKITEDSPKDNGVTMEKIQNDGDGATNNCSPPHTQTLTAGGTTTKHEDGSEDIADKTDKDEEKNEGKDEGQGSRPTHKDRPSIVDQVVRNTEKVFSMLKK